jgi:hypothetical protein
MLSRMEVYMRRLIDCVLAFTLVSTALTCFSQQTDVAQFAVFGAYSYLSTPSLNLTQRGFDGDFGYNLRSWLTLGGDFSYASVPLRCCRAILIQQHRRN